MEVRLYPVILSDFFFVLIRVDSWLIQIRVIREIRGSLSFCLSTFYLPPALSELRGFNLAFISVD